MQRYLQTILEKIEKGKLEEAEDLVDTMKKYLDKINYGTPGCCHETYRLKDGVRIPLCAEEGEKWIDCGYLKDEKEKFKARCVKCQEELRERIPLLYEKIKTEGKRKI